LTNHTDIGIISPTVRNGSYTNKKQEIKHEHKKSENSKVLEHPEIKKHGECRVY
jgi:hypothetical protein